MTTKQYNSIMAELGKIRELVTPKKPVPGPFPSHAGEAPVVNQPVPEKPYAAMVKKWTKDGKPEDFADVIVAHAEWIEDPAYKEERRLVFLFLADFPLVAYSKEAGAWVRQ